MKGLILAGGEGKRLEPLTQTRPKALIPLANKPIVVHTIESFKEAGITHVVLIVSPDGKVEEYLTQNPVDGVTLDFAVQDQPLGTGHAVQQAEAFLVDDFIVANGDNLVHADLLKKLIKKHKTAATLSLLELEDVSTLSAVVIDGDQVKEIVEKPQGEPPSHLAGIGTYSFSQKIFETLKRVKKSPRGELELPDAIQLLINDGEIVSYVQTDRWQHLSHPWDVLALNKEILDSMKSKNEGTVEKGATLKGEVMIGKGTLIKAGTYIEGPVLIGTGCTIGPNAFIRAYTVLGNNVNIGQSVEIKNTTVFNETKIPHLSYLGDSVIGENVNFGAGTVLTNLRHDGLTVKVNLKGALVDSGLRKLGAIVGDNAKFGSNVVVNPGRTIGVGALIWPGKVVFEDVPMHGEYK